MHLIRQTATQAGMRASGQPQHIVSYGRNATSEHAEIHLATISSAYAKSHRSPSDVAVYGSLLQWQSWAAQGSMQATPLGRKLPSSTLTI